MDTTGGTELGPKELFERKRELGRIDLDRIMFAEEMWEYGGPSCEELYQIGVLDTDHIVCGYDQGCGEQLYDCGAREDAAIQHMVRLHSTYASGQALNIWWYRLPPAKNEA